MKGRMWTGSMNRRDLLRAAAAFGGTATVAALVEACGGGPGGQPAKTSTSRSVVTIEHWDYYVSQSPYMANEIKWSIPEYMS